MTKLRLHLKPYLDRAGLSVIDDGQTEPGESHEEWFTRVLRQTRTAVCVISPEYIASDNIAQHRLKPLLEAAQAGNLQLLWLVVRPCNHQCSPLLAASALYDPDVPLNTLSEADQDRALVQISAGIVRWLGIAAPVSHSASKHREFGTFLRAYRARWSATCNGWRLHAGLAAGGRGRSPATLEQMYQPIRLGSGGGPERSDAGEVLLPEDLLRRRQPIIVRGPAGSGKTTWLRWIFRQLLRMEGDALPFLIALREVAQRWNSGCQGAERSIDAYLDDLVTGQMGRDARGIAGHFLRSEGTLKPVLLVDGWDELDRLGEEFREKLLGFLDAHPHVLAIVTSRPYGQEPPSYRDGFKELDILPLNDAEIAAFVHRYFSVCLGYGEGEAGEQCAGFLKEVDQGPGVRHLARNVLMLSMMLRISPSRPLARTRHVLYRDCVELLMSKREAEGVHSEQTGWRPEGGDERVATVAAMAATIHDRLGWAKECLARDELEGLLPREWPRDAAAGATRRRCRLEFVDWLSGPGSLLIENADTSLSFCHKGIQEYLTAWHLHSTLHDPARREEAFCSRATIRAASWWESLRLWAALWSDDDRGSLDSLMRALMTQSDQGCHFVGVLCADGLGDEALFNDWLRRFLRVATRRWSSNPCDSYWRKSEQDGRRSIYFAEVRRRAAAAPVIEWLRLETMSDKSISEDAVPLPDSTLASHDLARALRAKSPRDLIETGAISRVLSCGDPLWPRFPNEPVLLQLWPSRRRVAGLRLQLLVCCGATRADLVKVAPLILRAGSCDRAVQDTARHLARSLAKKLLPNILAWHERDPRPRTNPTFDWALELILQWPDAERHPRALSLARDWARDIALYASTHLTPYWIGEGAADIGGWDALIELIGSRWSYDCLSPDWTIVNRARAWLEDWAWFSPRSRLRHLSSALAQALVAPLMLREISPVLQDFAALDAVSIGWAGPRALIGHLGECPGPLSIFVSACQASLTDRSDVAALDKSIAHWEADVHPLWCALARYLARRPTDDDRAMLTALASGTARIRPDPTLDSNMLRFLVRGDVVLDGGDVIDLDEIASVAGVARLPYLEDLPGELVVDWSADEDRPQDRPAPQPGPPPRPRPHLRETPKVGRNDPCPCQSGRKYKRCCGASA